MGALLNRSGKARRISEMPVGAIMATDLILCEPQTPVAEAARRMAEARSSSIVVSEHDRVTGIWTEHDALGHDLSSPDSLDMPISQVMSTPVETVGPELTLADAALRFQQHNFRHFLVEDGEGKPCGIISRTDIVINHGVEWFMRLRTVRSAVTRAFLIGSRAMTLDDAARTMHDAGAEAIVIHDGTTWGILTERDIVRFIAQRRVDLNAADAASKPLATIAENDSLFHARNIMLERGFRHIGVVDDDAGLVGVVGFGDVLESIETGYIDELETVLSEREAALRESEERYRALVEQSPDAIAVHRAGQLLFINQAGCRLLGCEDDAALVGRQLADLLGPEHEHDHGESARDRPGILDTTPADSPVRERLRRVDGRVIDVEIAAMPITYDRLPASQLVMRDISQRTRMEAELRRLATTDQLTGAHNRFQFESHLEQMMKASSRYSSPLSMVILDIDHFKVINDLHGHDTGDWVLCRLVEYLHEHLRDTDVLARWGGDEFIILTPETDADGATRLAEKLREAIGRSDFGLVERLTISCGVGQYRPAESRAELFRRVDEAIYGAKRAGRDQVHHTT